MPNRKSRNERGEFVNNGVSRCRLALALGPGFSWVVVFLVVPLVIIVGISFLSRGDYGEVQRPFTFSNYARLAGFGDFGFDPLYPRIVLRSVLLGAGTAAACLLAALPLAFFIAGLPARRKTVALSLVVIPFWTNLLVRTYAWQLLLGHLYPSLFAVFIGMVCDYLPFMVLPLYASVEKLDWTLADAASDLGANGPRVFWNALLPQIRPGLAAGCILVFLPATGQFVIPDLLGGAKTMLLGNAIQQQFGASRNWPFGAAMASISILMLMIALWRTGRRSAEWELV